MLGSVERAVGAYERSGTYSDVSCIEHHGVVVDKHSLAKVQPVAMVAMEWWQYGYGVGNARYHVGEQRAVVFMVYARLVEFLACQA